MPKLEQQLRCESQNKSELGSRILFFKSETIYLRERKMSENYQHVGKSSGQKSCFEKR